MLEHKGAYVDSVSFVREVRGARQEGNHGDEDLLVGNI